ncbi:hypothetical protein [Anabaena lutea]|uniref:Uncharacterized protein n=1 Tax=Anabaena lutea FACHB-196 TaxID=2692881 RepID=A0ABR8FR09_9NOST|nr:hypothetical protein [Anabaena lutea]MBD2571374.1 hypothetical protein [Anabaena lutea FACHB-196]
MISPLPVWLNQKDKSVASALIGDGFEFVGTVQDIEAPDYLTYINGNWSLGCICASNSLIAICDGAVFCLDCVGESDHELRWNSTKKLIRSSLHNYQPSPTRHTQLSLFAA